MGYAVLPDDSGADPCLTHLPTSMHVSLKYSQVMVPSHSHSHTESDDARSGWLDTGGGGHMCQDVAGEASPQMPGMKGTEGGYRPWLLLFVSSYCAKSLRQSSLSAGIRVRYKSDMDKYTDDSVSLVSSSSKSATAPGLSGEVQRGSSLAS